MDKRLADAREEIARHFIIAAIWASAPEGTRPRASRQAKAAAYLFATEFLKAYPALSLACLDADGYGSHPDAGSPAGAFGHDLYLNCAGLGIGFSDRKELGEIGEALSEAIRQNWRRWHVETEFYRGWLYFPYAEGFIFDKA